MTLDNESRASHHLNGEVFLPWSVDIIRQEEKALPYSRQQNIHTLLNNESFFVSCDYDNLHGGVVPSSETFAHDLCVPPSSPGNVDFEPPELFAIGALPEASYPDSGNVFGPESELPDLDQFGDMGMEFAWRAGLDPDTIFDTPIMNISQSAHVEAAASSAHSDQEIPTPAQEIEQHHLALSASSSASQRHMDPELTTSELQATAGTSSHEVLQCEACARTFARRCDLNAHRKKHMRPYACTSCPRRFGTARDKDRHFQTHKASVKFRCCFPGCGFESTRRDSLTRHVSTKHVEEVRC